MWTLSQKNDLANFIVSLILIFACISSTNGKITVISLQSNESVTVIDDDLPANFLPEQVLEDGIEGFLVQSEPPNACTPVQLTPTEYFPPNVSFILIAQYSDCDFRNKIENARQAGYNGIIIHNVNSNTTDGMESTNTSSPPIEPIIYACFVGEHDGHRLITYSYPSQKWYYIRITNTSLLGNMFKLFVFFALWCASWFLIWCMYRICLCLPIMDCWGTSERDRRNRSIPTLESTTQIHILPITNWTEGDAYETCVVCLEDFVQNDKIRVLPCSHGFHSVCIDRWLTKERSVCPICNRMILVDTDGTYVLPGMDREADDDETPIFRFGPSTSNAPFLNPASSSAAFTFIQNLRSFQRESRRLQRRIQAHPHTPEDSSDSDTTSTSSSESESSWTTLSESVVTEIGSGPSRQSLPIFAQVQVPTHYMPWPSESQRLSTTTRAQESHLSPALDPGHGQSDVTVAIPDNHNINTDSDTVTSDMHPYFYTPCQEEPEDEEMLDCSVEVTDSDSGSPCVVVRDGESTLLERSAHNTI